MNSIVRNILNNTIGQEWIIRCLEMSELLQPEDFVNMDHKSVDNIEKYISLQLRLVDASKRKEIIDCDFIENPESFMFTPGVRTKLLKASKLISNYSTAFKNIYSSESDDSHSNKSMPMNDTTNCDMDIILPTETTLLPMDITENSDNCNGNSNNQFLLQLDPNNLKLEAFDRSKHLENLDKYYKDICKNASKNFADCKMKPKKDFHLTIPEDDFSNNTGYYHCHLCVNRNGLPTRIKFRFSKYNSVIYTNINSHLRIHFSYYPEVSDRKKPKLSQVLPTSSVTNDHETDAVVANGDFMIES